MTCEPKYFSSAQVIKLSIKTKKIKTLHEIDNNKKTEDLGFEEKNKKDIYIQRERYLKGGCPEEVKKSEQRVQGNTRRW